VVSSVLDGHVRQRVLTLIAFLECLTVHREPQEAR
jgi:hypothetical protein